jgi:transposase-like protein
MISTPKNEFKWKHFEGAIILLNVRWYCCYGLSYRNLTEMMEERGLDLAHTTIMRWVHQYAPEIDKKVRPHLKRTNKSWKVDETYINVKGKWKGQVRRSIIGDQTRAQFINILFGLAA